MLCFAVRYATTPSWCKASKFYLAFFFLLGFGFGVLTAAFSGHSYVALMRGLAVTPVSIVWLLIVRFLPLLITALVIFKFSSRLLIPLAFCKAFSYGFVLRLVYVAFPGAGWLVWPLFSFSDSVGIYVLYFLWSQNIPVSSCNRVSITLICVCCTLVATIIDYCLLSPYLAMLIKG